MATWSAFAPALDNDFVAWDDPEYVTENKLVLERTDVHDALLWRTPVSLNYHPLTMKSLVWDANRARQPDGTVKAAPFIRTNLVLHTLNALLVLVLAGMLVPGNAFVALFAALVFAVHPMHVESVAWVSERKDVLHALFWLMAAMAYVRYTAQRERNVGYWPWLLLAFVLFLAACLSKAMAVSLVPVLFLIDFWQRRRWHAGLLAEKLPFVAAAIFFGLLALDVQRGGDFHGLLTLTSARANAITEVDPFGWWDRITFAGHGFTQYIIRFLVPTRLCTYHPYPSAVDLRSGTGLVFLAETLVMCAAIMGAFWAVRRDRLWLFGSGFYLATVLLVLQLVPVGQVIMADRYTYLPYIGLSLLLAVLLDRLARRGASLRYAVGAGSVLFLLMLVGLTRRQVDTWQDSEALWGRVLELYPKAVQARVNLGNHYGKTGRIDEAIVCFEQAVQDGASHGAVFEGLGNAYGTKGDHARAEEMFTRALAAEPLRGSYYLNRGTSRLSQQKYEAAIADFDKALELEGIARRPGIRARRGYCLLLLGRYAEAVADYDQAIEGGHLDPNNFFYRAQARQLTGDTAGARSDLEQALRLRPDFPEAGQLLERYRAR
ncbi:MAG: tetratricopeptide repeat protein [Flavobacteriales bacterium]|nr:tetratricopeptide repeat protein [Flavobacteriales bacterium]